MKYKLELTDEEENTNSFTLETDSANKNLNNFILDALQISEDKRKLPFITQCPNGLEVYPSIKMKFENYGSSLLGDKLEAMAVTWRD